MTKMIIVVIIIICLTCIYSVPVLGLKTSAVDTRLIKVPILYIPDSHMVFREPSFSSIIHMYVTHGMCVSLCIYINIYLKT